MSNRTNTNRRAGNAARRTAVAVAFATLAAAPVVAVGLFFGEPVGNPSATVARQGDAADRGELATYLAFPVLAAESLPSCQYEDGNDDGRPCMWFDPDTGRPFYNGSENYGGSTDYSNAPSWCRDVCRGA